METTKKKPKKIELTRDEVDGLIEKVRGSDMSLSDQERLIGLIQTMVWMNQSLEEKTLSMHRLRKIFGVQTEKSSHILKTIEEEIEKDLESSEACSVGPEGKKSKKRPGHGRISAEDYHGARKVDHPHKELKVGMKCPGCDRGKLCSLPPGKLLRITAMPPLEATVHRPERLRCATCGELYTAEVPPEIGTEKYDGSACAMVSMLRYGFGMPMNRLTQFQKAMGSPLGVGTQWELIRRSSAAGDPVFEELIRKAAQGDLFYNDDTPMKILSLMGELKEAKENGENPDRTGMFTTGIVAESEGRKILLFFSGRKHAGENLEEVLSRRADGHEDPIQMCDGLSRNEPSGSKTKVANCLDHGRRGFYDIFSAFPEQVKHVIGLLKGVYRHEAIAKKEGMSSEERLRYHQENSDPLMEELKGWLDEQIEEKKAEPNSSLGKAIQYMRTRWEKLTLFLREPGAPLSNNECERLLKTAIRHRNNSLFYKTEPGAKVGDILMSLIQTATQAEVNPFQYLTALEKNKAMVAKEPDRWFPWNYEETLKALETLGPPP